LTLKKDITIDFSVAKASLYLDLLRVKQATAMDLALEGAVSGVVRLSMMLELKALTARKKADDVSKANHNAEFLQFFQPPR
jgi:hypothetical protein